MEQSVRRKAQRIDEAKERFPRIGERRGFIDFICWREYEDTLRFSFQEQAINFSKRRAKVTYNVVVGLLEQCLQLFGHDYALNIYESFSEYTFCSNKGDRVEGGIVQLGHLDAWMATRMVCLTDFER